MNDFPLRHLSFVFLGMMPVGEATVCKEPHLNGACAKLKSIGRAKKINAELPIAGKSLEGLPPEQWPCCVQERATFMAPFAVQDENHHALAAMGVQEFGHFRPTLQHFPPYSAGVVPFFWLMAKNLESTEKSRDLMLIAHAEPKFRRHTNWVTEYNNQRALLDGFSDHLRLEDSLCLFYAKHVPFVEGTSRVHRRRWESQTYRQVVRVQTKWWRLSRDDMGTTHPTLDSSQRRRMGS